MNMVRRGIEIEIKRRGGVVDAVAPVKSASFGNIRCDFYWIDDELWMTREQICRWSQQPKADEFFDWVYDVLEGLRKGELVLQSRSSVPAYTVLPDSKQVEAQAKLLDARTRQAKLVYQMAKEFKNTVGVDEIRCLISEAMKLIRQG